MITSNMTVLAANNDAELVAQTLSGNRDAFGQIVSRYQSLVCSLAYSATGSLGQSEDLAQETFITAWKHLGHLRERHKLRAWLCGIARNRINNFLRREGREPVRKAESLEEVAESHSPEPLPVDHTISNEEQAILWRSLARIPEIYREPLVLFYREHQSIESVAMHLDLTEDTVKQRLSRGRKMLQEQVLAFVEGALSRTNPDRTFTLGVLAALPAMSLSAKAATLGAAAAKGAGSTKAAGAIGWLGAIFTPLLVVVGNYANYKMSLNEAQTDIERYHVKRLFRNTLIFTLTLSVILAMPLLYWKFQHHISIRNFIGILFSVMVMIYFLTIFGLAMASLPDRKKYLEKLLKEKYDSNYPAAAYEFRSRATLFGLPLLHIRLGDRFDILRGPIKAWIAIGSSHSVGVIFASGGLAIAPFSFGGIAIGLFSFGAIGIGITSCSAIALGIWSFGALAFGWQACCGCGAALQAATGGIVFARDFAMGGIAQAAQVNNSITGAFFQRTLFFRISDVVAHYNLWILWVIPMLWQSRIVASARRREQQPLKA